MNVSLQDKIQKAHIAQNQWKRLPFEDRQKLIFNLSKILKNKADEFGKLITQEMNKPITQSIAEVNKSALMCEYYSKLDNVLMPETIETEFSLSEIRYVPKGVILGVMPWNFPFWQVLRFAVPTLLSGNTVLLKHASICFGSGDAIENLFLEAGFPEGIFQNLKIGHQEVGDVLGNPYVQGVSLTGSEKAGASVAGIAGQNIKKSLLELGGSDAFIVLDDADLAKAAKVGAQARLQNCGQTCVAAKRFIVQNNIKDAFLELFLNEYQQYIPANPLDLETKISGLARPDLADDLEKQYQLALENGAEIILPLERISSNEFKPGLILVKKGNPILKEELFGPLGMILIAENDEEALNLANDIPFGLANSVWTNSKERQLFFIENLDSGTVNINKMTSSDPRLPFGGVKKSGYGTELSQWALREFVNIKTVVIN